MISKKWKMALQISPVLNWLTPSAQGETVDLPFVILAKQRSGSTWVADLLNSHPAIRAYTELFLHGAYGQPDIGGNQGILMWSSWAARRPVPSNQKEQIRLYFEYLETHVFAAESGISAAGCKLMYDQSISAFAIPAFLKTRNTSIIHLIRNNHLDTILSQEGTRKRAVAHAEDGRSVTAISLTIEPESLLRRLEARYAEVQQAREYCRFMGARTIELNYEDLLTSIDNIRPVLSFLGVKSDIELNSSLIKLNSTSHRELIANYDDVARVLKGSPFEDLLRT